MTSVWANLREFDGSRATAFEELCSQLARYESPAGADFVRTGNPDAGVECYCTLSNGAEWGWQAKFFERALTPTQWNQLDGSVKKALDSHPRLTRYYVCVPRNRADGRRPDITTEMQKWHERVAKWRDWAADREMDVEFVWWGESELWDRLSQQEHSGRLEFWFGEPELFVESWFKGRLDEAVASAGARYTPELHVELPIAQTLELFGRTDGAGASVQQLANDIRRARLYSIRRLPTEDPSNDDLILKPLADARDKVIRALADFDCPPDRPWQVSETCEIIQQTLDLVDDRHQALASAERHHDEAHPVGEATHAGRSNPFHDAGFALRHLENQLWRTQDELRQRESVVNADLLIVTGDAGTGKTHLLCDVANHRISRGLPTVVLMGQRFLSKADPWTQVLEQLDLSSRSADTFVGALEAAAQAASCRALVIIDAINEGEGDAIWRAHLAPFLARLRRSPWIGTVLSVRTPYLERIVSEEVLQSAHRLEHHGFADSTYAAVQRYCEHFELEFPTTPLLRPEFDNPLFLKTLCEGLHRADQRRFPVGAEGITQVFDRYLDGVNADISDSLDLDRHTATVRLALDGFATELAGRRTYGLPRDDALELISAFAPTGGFSRSLYRALVDNGLLIEVPSGRQESEITVQVGFEWFADHLVARHIVSSHETVESLTATLDGENADGIAFALAWRPGLQDALTVLVPERYGVELLDVFWDDVSGPSMVEAFFRALPWRDPDTIGPRCNELVDAAFEGAGGYERWRLLDALVTCATIPGHPIGVESLDDRLRRILMPDRDAVWSTYLHYTYGQDGPVDRLLDWAEGLHATDSTADPDSARACAVVLAWFLTASNRFVRDRATKCLVALLHGHLDLAAQLVHRFRRVDDPYVCERVMAAAYGIAMRSPDAQALAPLAEAVYGEVFADGEPPVHYLTRDYARGAIERALYLGTEIDVDRSKIEPPYPSEWPHIPSDTELEKLDPDDVDASEEASDMERARGQIRFSVMHWDFGRYIIGTNSSSESRTWLSVPIHDPRWRSCDEQLEDFLDSLDADLREIFVRLIERKRPRPPTIRFVTGDESNQQGEADEPGFAFAIRPWLADLGVEQSVTQMLDGEQRERYDELMALRDRGEPRLSLEIIQRYVLWRAFDLGWTTDRFGSFDLRMRSLERGDTQKAERMGKKYQWIAYHEILAYISDHFQYRERYSDIESSNTYQGPWQSFERDIDPSVVVFPQRTQQKSGAAKCQWWAKEVAIPTSEEASNLDWVQRTDDIPGRDLQLYFTDEDAGSRWVKLHGMDIWKLPLEAGREEDELDYRELWLDTHGYFVPADAVDEFLNWAQEVSFWNRWLPEPPGDSRLFFGELGWSHPFQQILGPYLEPQYPEPFGDGQVCPVPLSAVAYSYAAENGGYDCSLAHHVPLLRPDSRIIDSLKLCWTGVGANYVDDAGELVAFDPSIYDEQRSSLMVREDYLSQYLTDTGSALVWAIVGEKRVRAPGNWGDAWAAFLQITGAYAHRSDAPTGRLSTTLQIVDHR